MLPHLRQANRTPRIIRTGKPIPARRGTWETVCPASAQGHTESPLSHRFRRFLTFVCYRKMEFLPLRMGRRACMTRRQWTQSRKSPEKNYLTVSSPVVTMICSALPECFRAIPNDRQNGLLMRPGGLRRNMAAMLGAVVGPPRRPSGHK